MAKWKGRPRPVLEIWGDRKTCVLLLGTCSSYGTRESPGQLYVGLHEAKSACAQGSVELICKIHPHSPITCKPALSSSLAALRARRISQGCKGMAPVTRNGSHQLFKNPTDKQVREHNKHSWSSDWDDYGKVLWANATCKYYRWIQDFWGYTPETYMKGKKNLFSPIFTPSPKVIPDWLHIVSIT